MDRKIYRRRHGERVWHGCANCGGWPDGDYEERARAPDPLELCPSCRRLGDALLCDAVRSQSLEP